MECNLELGDLRILLETAQPFEIEAVFAPFVMEQGDPDVRVRLVPDEMVADWQVTFSNEGRELETRYHPSREKELRTLRGCMMYIPMEELLLYHGRLLLHSSLVTTPKGGILFSGDSGCGKSTQAELWHTHRGGEVLNGDRVILHKASADWLGYGSPYAGSSGICLQRQVPLRAIVLPEHAGENAARRLAPGTAFKRLFLQIGADHSRQDLVNRVCDLLEELVARVPVYQLCGTPDVRAVEALEGAMNKEGL